MLDTPKWATMCSADGPGLVKAQDGKPAKFTVRTPGGTKPHSLTCLAARSSAPIFAMHAGDCPKPTVTADGKPVDMKDNGDGTFDCTYMPVCPGAPGYTEVSIKASFSTSASPLFLASPTCIASTLRC